MVSFSLATRVATAGALVGTLIGAPALPRNGKGQVHAEELASSSEEHRPCAEYESIELGLTKDEVLQRYGNPSAKSKTPEGEIWSYGSQGWQRMIPYYGPFAKPKFLRVKFDQEGRVVDYQVDQQGDVVEGSARPW
jgi:hypothetical protein